MIVVIKHDKVKRDLESKMDQIEKSQSKNGVESIVQKWLKV